MPTSKPPRPSRARTTARGAALRALTLGVALAAGTIAPPGWAQEPATRPLMTAPPPTDDALQPAEAVRTLLAQPYLTDAERSALRLFHGTWEPQDVASPRQAAAAALVSGNWNHAALRDAQADAHDRAEAAIHRGEHEAALELLASAEAPGVRTIRLRAEALEALGRLDEAGRAIDALGPTLETLDDATPEQLVEIAAALRIRARVSPQDAPEGGDFQRINQVLARARERAGNLFWPAVIAEAELLYDKGNSGEAHAAATQALALNPRLARAWFVLGSMSVDGFAFERTARFATELDALAEGVSPLAATLRARAALRQSDPDASAQALAPALERYPRATTLRALEAATAAARYDWAETDRLLAAFDERTPRSFEALFEVGRVLSEARQYDASDRYLARAAERAPLRAEPLAERGLMLIQAGRDGEALAVLRRAVELDPFQRRARNSLMLVEELARYERIETPHFVIRHAPGVDRVLARDMAALLEPMHRRVTGDGPGGIDHQPPGRTTIDIMPDARWFAVRITGLTRIHTMAASTGPALALESPRIGPGHSVGTFDWLRVLRHEFVHTVTLSRTSNRIPHWFTEAAAVYLEDAPRDYSTVRLLRDALEAGGLFDFGEINIAFIRPRRPSDRALAYAQSHWMYEFIVRRWGDRAPLSLMDLYAQGVREGEAIRRVLGLEPEAFQREFRAWARAQLVGWGVLPGPGLPTLLEIVAAEREGTDEARQAARQRAADRATGPGASGEAPDDGEPEPGVLVERGVPRGPSMDAEIARRWLEWYPDHPDLLGELVRAELRTRNDTPEVSMLPLLEKYAAARPVDPLPHQLRVRLGLAGAAIGEPALIESLAFLDAREQSRPIYAAELARRHADAARWPEALAKAERATILAPFDATLRELAATIALRGGEPERARRHLQALVELEPDREIHRKRLDAFNARAR